MTPGSLATLRTASGRSVARLQALGPDEVSTASAADLFGASGLIGPAVAPDLRRRFRPVRTRQQIKPHEVRPDPVDLRSQPAAVADLFRRRSWSTPRRVVLFCCSSCRRSSSALRTRPAPPLISSGRRSSSAAISSAVVPQLLAVSLLFCSAFFLLHIIV